MRKLLLCLAAPILFFAFSSTALADSLDFTLTSSLLMTGAPAEPFQLSFTLPSTISSLTQFTDVSVTLGGSSFTLPGAQIDFFPGQPVSAGLFDVAGNTATTFYLFNPFGAQSYTGTGPFTLLTGNFPLGGPSGNGNLMTLTGDVLTSNDFGSGSVNVTGGSPAGTPEPGTFALLGAGLFAIGALRRKFGLA